MQKKAAYGLLFCCPRIDPSININGLYKATAGYERLAVSFPVT
jgi:hypothetical protein